MFLLWFHLALQVWDTANSIAQITLIYHRRVGCKPYDMNTIYQVRTQKQIQSIINHSGDYISGLRKDILSPWDLVSKTHISNTHTSSQVKVGNPVNQIEQAEGSGEEDPRIGVHLGDTDMYPPMSPSSCSAVFETAEKTGTVLAVQTLIPIFFISLLKVLQFPFSSAFFSSAISWPWLKESKCFVSLQQNPLHNRGGLCPKPVLTSRFLLPGCRTPPKQRRQRWSKQIRRDPLPWRRRPWGATSEQWCWG